MGLKTKKKEKKKGEKKERNNETKKNKKSTTKTNAWDWKCLALSEWCHEHGTHASNRGGLRG